MTFPHPLLDDPRTLAEFEGWSEDITDVTSFDQLPGAAQTYVAAVEDLVGVPIRIVSVGPARRATFER